MTWEVSRTVWTLAGLTALLTATAGGVHLWFGDLTVEGVVLFATGTVLLMCWGRMRIDRPFGERRSVTDRLRRIAALRKRRAPRVDADRKRKQEEKRRAKPPRWAWIRSLPRRGKISGH